MASHPALTFPPAPFRPHPRHSPHVVRLLGACLDDKCRLALVMELCEGGSLAQRIYSPSKRRLEHLEVRRRAVVLLPGASSGIVPGSSDAVLHISHLLHAHADVC